MGTTEIILGIVGLVLLIFIESKTHLIRKIWEIFMG